MLLAPIMVLAAFALAGCAHVVSGLPTCAGASTPHATCTLRIATTTQAPTTTPPTSASPTTATSTTAAAPPKPTAKAPAPPAPPAPVTAPSGAGFVRPGTVGYRGSTSGLTIVDGSHPVPAGIAGACHWSADGLRCDSNTVTLDHLYVRGGVYFTGTGGKLTITNSIIEGGTAWYVVDLAGGAGTTVEVDDSTLRWPIGKQFPSGYDVGAIHDGSGAGPRMILHRDEISGLPQGLDPDGDNSIVDSCWIHDLIHTGSMANGTDTHVDGVFAQGGRNLTLTHNYIDVSNQFVNGVSWATAAFFTQDNAPDSGYVITDNFLAGGSYVFYNEAASGADVERNVLANGVYGPVQVTSLGSTGRWLGNISAGSAAIPAPAK
jgi:hypothetical protein